MRSHSAARKSHLRSQAISHATLGVVSIALGISLEAIQSTSRCASAVYGRQLAMYLLNTTFQMNFSLAGRALGRDRTTASYSVKKIEERRDDPLVETVLAACENSLAGIRALAVGKPPVPPRRPPTKPGPQGTHQQ